MRDVPAAKSDHAARHAPEAKFADELHGYEAKKFPSTLTAEDVSLSSSSMSAVFKVLLSDDSKQRVITSSISALPSSRIVGASRKHLQLVWDQLKVFRCQSSFDTSCDGGKHLQHAIGTLFESNLRVHESLCTELEALEGHVRSSSVRAGAQEAVGQQDDGAWRKLVLVVADMQQRLEEGDARSRKQEREEQEWKQRIAELEQRVARMHLGVPRVREASTPVHTPPPQADQPAHVDHHKRHSRSRSCDAPRTWLSERGAGSDALVAATADGARDRGEPGAWPRAPRCMPPRTLVPASRDAPAHLPPCTPHHHHQDEVGAAAYDVGAVEGADVGCALECRGKHEDACFRDMLEGVAGLGGVWDGQAQRVCWESSAVEQATRIMQEVSSARRDVAGMVERAAAVEQQATARVDGMQRRLQVALAHVHDNHEHYLKQLGVFDDVLRSHKRRLAAIERRHVQRCKHDDMTSGEDCEGETAPDKLCNDLRASLPHRISHLESAVASLAASQRRASCCCGGPSDMGGEAVGGRSAPDVEGGGEVEACDLHLFRKRTDVAIASLAKQLVDHKDEVIRRTMELHDLLRAHRRRLSKLDKLHDLMHTTAPVSQPSLCDPLALPPAPHTPCATSLLGDEVAWNVWSRERTSSTGSETLSVAGRVVRASDVLPLPVPDDDDLHPHSSLPHDNLARLANDLCDLRRRLDAITSDGSGCACHHPVSPAASLARPQAARHHLMAADGDAANVDGERGALEWAAGGEGASNASTQAWPLDLLVDDLQALFTRVNQLSCAADALRTQMEILHWQVATGASHGACTTLPPLDAMHAALAPREHAMATCGDGQTCSSQAGCTGAASLVDCGRALMWGEVRALREHVADLDMHLAREMRKLSNDMEHYHEVSTSLAAGLADLTAALPHLPPTLASPCALPYLPSAFECSSSSSSPTWSSSSCASCSVSSLCSSVSPLFTAVPTPPRCA